MDIQELIDREEIRHLMSRYNIGGDRFDLDELASTFAEDGILEFGEGPSQGRAAIRERLGGGGKSDDGSAKSSKLSVLRHHLGTSLLTVNGDTANARTYFIVHTNNGPDHHGVYVDRFVRTGEGWRIAHRVVRIDWQSENSLMQPLYVRGRAPT
jgi:hypothetical protein